MALRFESGGRHIKFVLIVVSEQHRSPRANPASDRPAHPTGTHDDDDVVVHSSLTDMNAANGDRQVMMTGRVSQPRTVEVRACTAWS